MCMKLYLAFLLAIVLCLDTVSSGQCAESLPLPLLQAQQQTGAEFSRIDADLSQTAKKLGQYGLTGIAARLSLRDLCGRFSYAIDCTAVNAQGIMVTIEPAPFSRLENSDISQQPQIRKILKTHHAVLSPVFHTVEGIDAVDAEYPVISPDGQYIGSVSFLFSPESLLELKISPITQGLPVHIWAMEPGGRILYDRDNAQIGLNLFGSELYRPYLQLISLGRDIAMSPEGTGVYEFISPITKEQVKNKADWQSVSLFGSEWRLVSTYAQPKNIHGRTTALPTEKLRQALDVLLKNPALIEALKTDNAQMTLSMFKEFYDNTPGIYSIQWVNASIVNRFGFPLENSLSNYDFKDERNDSDTVFANLVGKQLPAEFVSRLFEGTDGRFLLAPVFDQNDYLGMVYIITLHIE